MKKIILYTMFCIFCAQPAWADFRTTTEQEREYFRVKYVELRVKPLPIMNHIGIPNPCETGYIYNFLREELDKYLKENDEPVRIYGCDSPEGNKAPKELQSETLYFEFYYNVTRPQNYVQEVKTPWFIMDFDIYRNIDKRPLRPWMGSMMTMPLTDDQAKKEEDFFNTLNQILKNAASLVNLGRPYYFSEEERAKIKEEQHRKIIQSTKNFIEKFGHDPEKIRKKHEIAKGIYRVNKEKFPDDLEAIYAEYFESVEEW